MDGKTVERQAPLCVRSLERDGGAGTSCLQPNTGKDKVENWSVTGLSCGEGRGEICNGSRFSYGMGFISTIKSGCCDFYLIH